MKKSIIFISLLCLMTIVLSGCRSGDEEKIKEVIMNYNQNLPVAMVRPDPDIIKPFAGDSEYKRLSIFINNLTHRNRLVDGKLKNLEITGISFADAKTNWNIPSDQGQAQVGNDVRVDAIANTVESWDYRYLDYGSKKPLGNFKRVSYLGEYYLSKINDKWVVVYLKDVDNGTVETQGGK